MILGEYDINIFSISIEVKRIDLCYEDSSHHIFSKIRGETVLMHSLFCLDIDKEKFMLYMFLICFLKDKKINTEEKGF